MQSASIHKQNALTLQVVALVDVLPHEHVDPRRVERLAYRLETEDALSNPPIVIETSQKYIVLDGATRVTAFKQLGYPHIVVQVVSPDQLDLHTWFHVIRDTQPAALIERFRALPEIKLVECSAATVFDQLNSTDALCYLHSSHNTAYLAYAAPGVNRLHALNTITASYHVGGNITRTLSNNLADVKHEVPDMSVLIVFPKYTVEQVLEIAQAGRVIPAGITRFIIPGRVLRLNANLAYLMSDKPLAEKNEWLRKLILEKFERNMVRYYQEPVYLLDE
jgi:hypothetical protein